MEKSIKKSMSMSKSELRNIIVSLREDNLSYQEISDYLRDKHGIVRSRQAIHGIYSRANDIEKKREEKEIINKDIINLYCLLGSKKEVLDALRELGNSTYGKVLNDAIGSGKEQIEKIKAGIVDKIKSEIPNLPDIKDLEGMFEYKGIQISRSVLEGYIIDAYKSYIEDAIRHHAVDLYKLTGSKSIPRKLCESFNIHIVTRDLGN